MSREDNVRRLKDLISNFERISEELSEMHALWKDHGDPCSDPGLQYEKEAELNKAYSKIFEYAKSKTI